ncbi:hypothetical protein NQ314_000696 [Rhamnusium bicolor]|uniref:DDE Tnp4 domain-containing protein n=1 Tax=Rhamnusium bicolor TaxID=1586634 RepID=A0AAV8ZTR4_9CUCU|nr:hypothetical protein NQ314_000696 [Rhamnusium bicolor]
MCSDPLHNPAHAGATHDSFIWCYNEGDRNSWLLGDSGYPLQPWLMVPFQNAAHNSPKDRLAKDMLWLGTALKDVMEC